MLTAKAMPKQRVVNPGAENTRVNINTAGLETEARGKILGVIE